MLGVPVVMRSFAIKESEGFSLSTDSGWPTASPRRVRHLSELVCMVTSAGTFSKPCLHSLTHPNPQAVCLLFFRSRSNSRTFPPFSKPQFHSRHLQVRVGLRASILSVSMQETLPKHCPLLRPRPFTASRFAVSTVLSPRFGKLGVLASHCLPDPERIPPNSVPRAKKNRTDARAQEAEFG